MITRLSQLVEAAAVRGRRRLAVAYAQDAHTLQAVEQARRAGLVDPILIGDTAQIRAIASAEKIDLADYRIVEQDGDVACVATAVEMVRSGNADILMKGLVSTDRYMRGILKKEGGLLPPKGVLSHVTLVEIPQYHKLLAIADVAVIPAPDLNQKVAITNYVLQVARLLQIERPKVALIAATEQMLPGMQACVDAAMISKMAERGQLGNCGLVDGPLALDVALDAETARIKKLSSPVAGDADCLVFPNIESANVFFKTSTKLCGGSLAAMVMGTTAPCVLTSRGDSEASKLYSIALASLSAK